ncbi:MAG: hypothetical protein PF904_20245 [Kiritimatiellae bacterium]|jgi:hypothetical protein|nr:hypothetical protein [Kiritimatiellia bacterium]
MIWPATEAWFCHRYSALDWRKSNRPLHGYASDDYLSNTIIGGRNPMCQGPFSRSAVMTYWLQHDICADLGRQDFETHAFGKTIRQQHTTFDKGGKVWSNRGDEGWTVCGDHILPKYGYYSESGKNRSGIVMLDGQRAAFAQSKDSIFVDARPLFDPLEGVSLAADVSSGKYLGKDKFSFTVKWEVKEAVTESYKPFLHFDIADKDLDGSETIAFQCGLNLPKVKLQQPGTFETTTTITVPKEVKPGAYAIRFGLYNKSSRLRIAGNNTSTHRIKGGIIAFEKKGSDISSGSYKPESNKDINKLFEYNTEGRTLDFGSIQTDGAFRVLHHGSKSWTLIPLPGSRKFSAAINLKKLGATNSTVKSVTALEPKGDYGKEIEWSQEGDVLSLKLNARAFGYEIRF